MTVTWALSFFALHELSASPRARTAFLAGFYALVGLSLLAKGLVGIVIPFGVLTFYYLARRQWPERHVWLSLFWGTPIALAVSATWYGPVIARHGWLFIDQFFIQHHFARYISNKYHHTQRFYFYLLILVPLTLPWTAFLVEALIRIRGSHLRALMKRSPSFIATWLVLPSCFSLFPNQTARLHTGPACSVTPAVASALHV